MIGELTRADLDKQQSSDLTTEQAFILRRMILLARQIRGNKQLKQILRKVDAKEREAFYVLLKPHLSFKPVPYFLINR